MEQRIFVGIQKNAEGKWEQTFVPKVKMPEVDRLMIDNAYDRAFEICKKRDSIHLNAKAIEIICHETGKSSDETNLMLFQYLADEDAKWGRGR